MEKDQGSVGRYGTMLFRVAHISGELLPTLPRRPSVATPSAEGEF